MISGVWVGVSFVGGSYQDAGSKGCPPQGLSSPTKLQPLERGCSGCRAGVLGNYIQTNVQL